MTEQTQNTESQAGVRPMFFNKLLTLDRVLHAGLKLDTQFGYGFAAKSHLIPITIAEFRFVSRQYPIIFSAGEIPMPFAVVGLPDSRTRYLGMLLSDLVKQIIEPVVRCFAGESRRCDQFSHLLQSRGMLKAGCEFYPAIATGLRSSSGSTTSAPRRSSRSFPGTGT